MFVVAGCGREEVVVRTGPPDVLFISVDTFRADRAGCHGHPGGLTPELDRLFRRGLHAAHAYAPAPITAPSHASLLTSLEPPSHGVRDNATYPLEDDVPTLSTLLQDRGFRTGAFIAAFPLAGRFGFARGFEHFDEEIEAVTESPTYYAERPAETVVDAAVAWVRDLPANDRWFAWTHFFDPHHPHVVPRSLQRLPANSDYDREVRGLDLQIGRLLRELEATAGRLPIVAVASDHGEALGGHGESSHGLLLYEETTRALFAIVAPGLQPALHREIVRHVDLLPTLFDILELEIPDHAEGRWLLEAEPADVGAYSEAYSPAYNYGWSPLLSWRDDRWTYIEGPDPELYDRWNDPREKRNVRDEHPDIVNGFAREIAKIAVDAGNPADEALDDEARSKLLALGYLGGGTGSLSFRSDKDPKKLVVSATALFRGITLFLNESKPQEALPYLQRAYRADPDNMMAVYYLAFCLNRLGDATTAMSYYRRTIELNPRAAEAWAHLAVLEFERGRPAVAFDLLAEGLDVNPRSFPLLMTSGDLHGESDNPAKADSLFRSAAAIEPERPEPWVRLAELAESAGDAPAARAHWARAIDADPDHPLIPDRVR
jgi:arylsulfatase A-like enzyme/Flp pilus assembly protein TadD